jgi:putative ABC transport system permease protein
MYWVFVKQAMRLRARRLLLAFSALAVASALATALFSIYSDVERRVRAEFSTYGANLLITSRSPVPLAAAESARKLGAVAAPFAFATGTLAGQPVSLAGTNLSGTGADPSSAGDLTKFWHIEGSREGCLVGVNIAQRFHLHIGEAAPLEAVSCQITGIVSTGAAEDNELILPFASVAKLAGLTNAANLIQVRAPGDRLESIRASLQASYPTTEVRIVEAIAETETGVVRKIRVALFLLLAVILVITTMSVSSNFSELVMERSREIGILKAIGAAERKIASLFVTESILLALASALAGYFAGLLLAGWIGQSVFSVPFTIHIELPVLAAAAALTLAVALAATALAASSIWRIQPSRILRGE